MNNQVSDTERADLGFCWDQVMRVRPQFRLTHAYAPKEISSGILAMHALFAALEEAVSNVSAEEVSRAKLVWWQQELMAHGAVNSRHPIVRMLERSFTRPEAIHDHLRSLLDLSIQRVDAVAISDEAALRQFCQELGAVQMRLEFALEPGNTEDDASLAKSCDASGLLQLLRESVRLGPDRAFWWLPLNLLARFGLNRAEFVDGGVNESSINVMKSIYSAVLDRHRQPESRNRFATKLHSKVGSTVQRHRHWLVQSALQLRLLDRLEAVHPRKYLNILSTTRLSDAWFAWRVARQCPAGGE